MDKITDLMKFGIMILIYTGYMTWWAAGVSHTVGENKEILNTHILADNLITNQTILLAQTVKVLQKQQELNNTILRSTIEQHAKCAEIMRNVVRRVNKLEDEK